MIQFFLLKSVTAQASWFYCDPTHMVIVIGQLMSPTTISPSAIVLLEIPLLDCDLSHLTSVTRQSWFTFTNWVLFNRSLIFIIPRSWFFIEILTHILYFIVNIWVTTQESWNYFNNLNHTCMQSKNYMKVNPSSISIDVCFYIRKQFSR